MEDKKRARISLIIPVYNAEKDIKVLLEALMNLNYPKDKLEIIIVDNGSSDRTKEFVQEYPVILLEENEVQSSYAARNRAIQKASGDILVFTDADCTPNNDWLTNGVNTLLSEDADLAGGDVEFVYSQKFDPAEVYDSITHMQISENIAKGTAKTANLFVKKESFDKVGPFPITQSGGDVAWTKRVTDAGYKLAFAEDAVVKHPARPLRALLKKDFRVGQGQLQNWIEGKKKSRIIYLILRAIFPPRISQIKQKLAKKNISTSKKILSVWCISYISILIRRAGLLYQLIKGS